MRTTGITFLLFLACVLCSGFTDNRLRVRTVAVDGASRVWDFSAGEAWHNGESNVFPQPSVSTGVSYRRHISLFTNTPGASGGIDRYEITSTGVRLNGKHPDGTLTLQTTTDEDNHIEEVSTDFRGNTLCLRNPATTHYIYNDFGELAYILPPGLTTTYNSLGQPVTTGHGDGVTRNYTYNIHGWLTNTTTSTPSRTLTETLHYETGRYPCYNGNISAKEWTNGRYDYQYDTYNRLKAAEFDTANYDGDIPPHTTIMIVVIQPGSNDMESWTNRVLTTLSSGSLMRPLCHIMVIN